MQPRVAVIGGGISGLAAAHRLLEVAPETNVLLLEASPRLGGVLHTDRQDGFVIEWGADNFLTHPTSAVDLCRKAGLEETLIGTDPERRQAFVVHRGKLKPIPAGFLVMAPSRVGPIAATPILSVRAKLRMGLEYVVPRRTTDEDESLAAFVRRRFGHEIYERLVQPLVGGIFTGDPEQLSLAATMPHFREMEREHGSLIRAMLRKRRQQPSESSGGARYGQFAAPRHGMSSLVDALAERMPADSIRLDAPVDGVVPIDRDRWLLAVGGEHPDSVEVDAVVVAAPAHHASELIAGVHAGLARELRQIEYSSCAIVSLGYRRDQIKHPLNGFGFVVPLVEDRSILSCSFSSVKYAGRAPDGFVLLRVFIGGACQRGLLQFPRQQIIELAEREVGALLRIEGTPVLSKITRQNRAMPQYDVGHCERISRIDQQLSGFPTLALAGNAYRGVGVPACIRSGEAAADRLLAKLQHRQTSSVNTLGSMA